MSTVRVDLGERYTGVRSGILLVMSTGTRATVRMEEQMALLMQKLDEQCQQIKCLTERQSTQLGEMERRQYQMEKRVNSLMEEQETLQQEMRLKHKQDSEADTLAQPQTFSGYSGPVAATIQKPMPFDRSIPWDTYKLQFEAVAMMNHWGEQDKAAHLIISLRGPATGVLSSLPPEEHHNYAALTAALEICFGAKHQVELNRMRLRSRTHRRGEGLPELAEDIERLTRLAYPDAPATMIEVLARDQFLDAIPDEDLQVKVRQSRPPTLRQALAVSLELESLCLASKQRMHTVREAALEEEGSEDEQPDHHKIIHHLTELVRCAMREPRQMKTQEEQHASRRQRAVTCWHCGKKGHVRRECPTRGKPVTQSASLPGNGQ